MEPRHVADLLSVLRGAVDEGDSEAERYFRRHAAWMFTRALETYAVSRAMSGGPHLPRRRALASHWDVAMASRGSTRWRGTIDLQSQQWILDAARQQRDCPRSGSVTIVC